MENRPYLHQGYMRHFFFFLWLANVAVTNAQELKTTIIGYDVQQYVSYNDAHLLMHMNAKGNADGPVKIYKLKGADTLCLFKANTKDGYLVDQANWYDKNGQLTMQATFMLPETGVVSLNRYSEQYFYTNYQGILNGQYVIWQKDRNNDKYYKSDIWEYKKGKKDGWSVTYYPNGQMSEKAFYKNDLKEDLHQSWYENGKLKSEGIYKTNMPEGEWKYFSDAGNLTKREFYGEYTMDSLHTYDEEGSLEKRQLFFRKAVDDTYLYKSGKLYRYYRTIKRLKQGEEITYHPDGSKASVVKNIDGMNEGLYESWYPNGKPYQRYNNVHGYRDGAYISFYPNGKTKAKGEYTNSHKTGTWVHYKPDGKLLKEITPEMELEENVLHSEVYEVVEEAPAETVMFIAEMPHLFLSDNGFKVFDIKELSFLKKYDVIKVKAHVNNTGRNTQYEIFTPMKEEHRQKLMQFFAESKDWVPMKMNGRAINCVVEMMLTYKKK